MSESALHWFLSCDVCSWLQDHSEQCPYNDVASAGDRLNAVAEYLELKAYIKWLEGFTGAAILYCKPPHQNRLMGVIVEKGEAVLSTRPEGLE